LPLLRIRPLTVAEIGLALVAYGFDALSARAWSTLLTSSLLALSSRYRVPFTSSMYAPEVRLASQVFALECRAQFASSSVPLHVSADPIADSPATIAPIVISLRILISSIENHGASGAFTHYHCKPVAKRTDRVIRWANGNHPEPEDALQRIAVALALFVGLARGQTFDVATIKPSPPLGSVSGPMGPKGGPGTDDPGRYWCNYCQLDYLISQAFDVPFYRIVSAGRLPDDFFHIVATVPPGATPERFRAMLRALLADRFKLTTHGEQREYSMYRLTVSAGAPKLKPHVEGAPPEQTPPSCSPCISYKQRGKTVAEFAKMLEGRFRSPVEDATGLTGKYDFDLSWSVSDDSDSGLPTIYAAIQSLGLRLAAGKGKLDAVIVDHVEKPTQN
jgi:uncharacterized protein (TIGR03435 family)